MCLALLVVCPCFGSLCLHRRTAPHNRGTNAFLATPLNARLNGDTVAKLQKQSEAKVARTYKFTLSSDENRTNQASVLKNTKQYMSSQPVRNVHKKSRNFHKHMSDRSSFQFDHQSEDIVGLSTNKPVNVSAHLAKHLRGAKVCGPATCRGCLPTGLHKKAMSRVF